MAVSPFEHGAMDASGIVDMVDHVEGQLFAWRDGASVFYPRDWEYQGGFWTAVVKAQHSLRIQGRPHNERLLRRAQANLRFVTDLGA
jgi:hypothetical protein